MGRSGGKEETKQAYTAVQWYAAAAAVAKVHSPGCVGKNIYLFN